MGSSSSDTHDMWSHPKSIENQIYNIKNKSNKTIKKDFFGNTVIEDEDGNKQAYKKDFFGNIFIEDNRGNR